jgi:hypothetical protein
MSRFTTRGLSCVRVHRARRMQRAVHCAAALIALGASARIAAAQQPYPGYPQYPTYPTQPPAPYPGYPTVPGTPTLPTMPGAPGQPPALAAYRLPVITIAQPTEGVVLPDDRPVAILRFAAGEALDPIDALTLQVFVDGDDRTSLFTLAQNEAWGRLSPGDELLAAGQHEVRARICSTRGACGVARATVTVVATGTLLQQLGSAGEGAAASRIQGPSRRTRVLGAVLQAMRVLIK